MNGYSCSTGSSTMKKKKKLSEVLHCFQVELYKKNAKQTKLQTHKTKQNDKSS